jgi:predicted MPP superfamily phosphohydrolase
MNVIPNFSRAQQAWERVQALLTPTDWPARLAWRLGVRETVVRVDVDVAVDKPIGTAPAIRVAFASDLHAGPTTQRSLIEQACQQLVDARADVILLGGDFISIRAEYADTLVAPLSTLRAPLGVFAVFGNHDHWSGLARVERALDRAGIERINNQSRRLPPPFERTLIVGLDDHSSGRPNPDGPSWDASLVTVVVMHQPSGLLDVGDRPFDVALAGHTHGGHIVLGGFAPVAPQGALSRTYRVGRYDLPGARTLLVSRGIGHGALPFRFGAPSDVIVCTLRAAKTAYGEYGR